MKKTTWFVMIILIPVIVFIFLLIFWVDLFHTGIEGNERFFVGLGATDIGIVIFIYFIIYRWVVFFEDSDKEIADSGEKQ